MRPEEAEAQQNRFRMSELDSLASQNVQAFTLTQEDAAKAKSGNSHVIVGNVGIRCIHCHRRPPLGGRRDVLLVGREVCAGEGDALERSDVVVAWVRPL